MQKRRVSCRDLADGALLFHSVAQWCINRRAVWRIDRSEECLCGSEFLSLHF